MLESKSHIPRSIYRLQPYIYVGSGVLTLIYLPNIYGIVSGLLLIGAGVLVIVWRSGKATKKPKRNPAPRGRNRTKRTADMPYMVKPGGRDNKRASRMTLEQDDLSITENAWPGNDSRRPVHDPVEDINDGDPVTCSLLSRFSPFNELNESLKEFFARGLVVSKKPAGSVLIERGSKDDLSIYLIEGTLVLEAADGKKIHIVGGTPGAFFPVCQLSPHIYTAIPTTEVSVIMLSQNMLREVTKIIAKYKNMSGIQVSQLLDT